MTKTRNQKQYTIQGTILNQNKKPVKGVLIRATDLDPQTSEKLIGGHVYTDEKGKYIITFRESDFRTRDRKKVPT
ncbi:carboxypeptidase-like regulatory domain-containing protein [Mangrovivirga cuniculi]|uniref:Carboxypeptidase regulatory-like domain-containing protein n=1 Tax=Mangrovivirga cuniculi TaxID=2715131 RepID=A0A4D7JRC2_9BACT|nr:carboxypeptidase-like regulatory domain-containing protein [Mangrovivirga cuniculi]QCK15292.1 hypothetical protein DCC35_11305 [Mangrovivirga cuniculi]